MDESTHILAGLPYLGPFASALWLAWLLLRRIREAYWLTRPWKDPPGDLWQLTRAAPDWEKIKTARYGPKWTRWWLGLGTTVFWAIIIIFGEAGTRSLLGALSGLLFYGLVVPIAAAPIALKGSDKNFVPAIFSIIVGALAGEAIYLATEASILPLLGRLLLAWIFSSLWLYGYYVSRPALRRASLTSH